MIRSLVFVTGLLEPRAAFWALRRRLGRHEVPIEFFRDRLIFRDLENSVERLAKQLSDNSLRSPIGVVTHSFGDWTTRRAIARAPNHGVAALVSIAPVMRGGFLSNAAHFATRSLIPEIDVIGDAARAAADLDCDDRVRRLVIWAKADESLRQVDLSGLSNVEVRRVAATHMSVVVQPGVLNMVDDFLFAGMEDPHAADANTAAPGDSGC